MIRIKKPEKIDAVSSLGFENFHGAGVEGSPFIFPNGETPPTEAEIQAEIVRLQAEYDAQAYSRKREAEYPSIQECVHAILDDELTALQEKRQAVKTKYPKS